MTENAKRLTVFAAVVHNAIDSALLLVPVLEEEFQRVESAIDLFPDGQISPGMLKAALSYRDHLIKFKQLTEVVSSVDTNYFLESDYQFTLPDEES